MMIYFILEMLRSFEGFEDIEGTVDGEIRSARHDKPLLLNNESRGQQNQDNQIRRHFGSRLARLSHTSVRQMKAALSEQL